MQVFQVFFLYEVHLVNAAELCFQIKKQLQSYGYFLNMGVKFTVLFGT